MKILVIKRWFPFNFAKILQGRHFVVGRPKNLKVLLDIFFDNDFQKVELSSFLLFSCACYYFDLDDVHRNRVETSTTLNFSSSWLLYLHFSNIINLCPAIVILKKGLLKKHKLLIFLKGRFSMLMLACLERLLWAF